MKLLKPSRLIKTDNFLLTSETQIVTKDEIKLAASQFQNEVLKKPSFYAFAGARRFDTEWRSPRHWATGTGRFDSGGLRVTGLQVPDVSIQNGLRVTGRQVPERFDTGWWSHLQRKRR